MIRRGILQLTLLVNFREVYMYGVLSSRREPGCFAPLDLLQVGYRGR
jgi:hypothetical protein